MFGIFSRRRDLTATPPRTPAGMRIYAVGDIHGRDDLLRRLQERILEDAAHHPNKRKTLVYLGDYLDRGPDSREVLERLSRHPLPGFVSVHLMGNHEQALLGFAQDPETYSDWLLYGGLATLNSYGVADPGDATMARPPHLLARELRDRLPEHHQTFLDGLERKLLLGDYLFVHAGIRPRVPLDLQAPNDLLWIRDDFLRYRRPHPHFVVHGHHISAEPDVRPNRIGIDTGAFATGRLTGLILDGEARSFVDTR